MKKFELVHLFQLGLIIISVFALARCGDIDQSADATSTLITGLEGDGLDDASSEDSSSIDPGSSSDDDSVSEGSDSSSADSSSND